MGITLKRVEDCLLSVEKTEISITKKKWLNDVGPLTKFERSADKNYLELVCYNLFCDRAMKPSYL